MSLKHWEHFSSQNISLTFAADGVFRPLLQFTHDIAGSVLILAGATFSNSPNPNRDVTVTTDILINGVSLGLPINQPVLTLTSSPPQPNLQSLMSAWQGNIPAQATVQFVSKATSSFGATSYLVSSGTPFLLYFVLD